MALAICFIVPLAGAAWLVESFGVNVFWPDGWRMTDLLTGPFSMKELFETYNEHAYVLPRLAAIYGALAVTLTGSSPKLWRPYYWGDAIWYHHLVSGGTATSPAVIREPRSVQRSRQRKL